MCEVQNNSMNFFVIVNNVILMVGLKTPVTDYISNVGTVQITNKYEDLVAISWTSMEKKNQL